MQKIAILGKAPSSLAAFPGGPDWQVWTLSDLVAAAQVERSDLHFELHPIDWIKRNANLAAYWRWLCETETPIMLREPVAEISSGAPYPVREITAKYGRYFTNSVSWMLALAIEQKPAVIGLFGVDMAQTPEYRRQRPSCEWLIGRAQGAGIDVLIPAESDLLKCRRLYGIEDRGGDMWAKCQVRRRELRGRLQQAQQRQQEAAYEEAVMRGGLDAMDWTEQWL